jgi:hypothetical protein
MSIDKLHSDQSRATRARDLLENDLLAEAFEGLEAAYIAAWRSTTIDDNPGREKLFLAVNVIGKVRDHLNKVLSDGKLAAAELRALAQTAEPPKTWADVQ